MPPRINVPPLTRFLLVALLALTVFNAAIAPPDVPYYRVFGAPYLVIVPGKSIAYPWVFLTATFVEQNFIGLVISGLTIFYGGRYLERAWSSAEFAKFILFASMIPNLITFLLFLLWYALTGSGPARNTQISSCVSLYAALLVTFKQLLPEHNLALFRTFIRIRLKHLPALYLLVQLVSLFALRTASSFFLSISSFMVTWIYLRFYRSTPTLSASTGESGSTVRGDASDTFSFASFFPDAVQPPIAAFSNAVFDFLVALKVCTPFSAEAIDAGNEQAAARVEGGLPSLMGPGGGRGGGRAGGGRREEAERRRALALKALDQRIAAAGRGPTVVQAQSSSDAEASDRTEEIGNQKSEGVV